MTYSGNRRQTRKYSNFQLIYLQPISLWSLVLCFHYYMCWLKWWHHSMNEIENATYKLQNTLTNRLITDYMWYVNLTWCNRITSSNKSESFFMGFLLERNITEYICQEISIKWLLFLMVRKLLFHSLVDGNRMTHFSC